MPLPGPLRATVGLIVSVAEETRKVPGRALELPLLAVSSALQASLRAQQRYARLTARGDEALSRGRTVDEPPAWATFDDDLPARQSSAEGLPTEDHDDGPDPRTTRRAPAKRARKTVSSPRHVSPSRFDTVDVEPDATTDPEDTTRSSSDRD